MAQARATVNSYYQAVRGINRKYACDPIQQNARVFQQIVTDAYNVLNAYRRNRDDDYEDLVSNIDDNRDNNIEYKLDPDDAYLSVIRRVRTTLGEAYEARRDDAFMGSCANQVVIRDTPVAASLTVGGDHAMMTMIMLTAMRTKAGRETNGGGQAKQEDFIRETRDHLDHLRMTGYWVGLDPTNPAHQRRLRQQFRAMRQLGYLHGGEDDDVFLRETYLLMLEMPQAPNDEQMVIRGLMFMCMRNSTIIDDHNEEGKKQGRANMYSTDYPISAAMFCVMTNTTPPQLFRMFANLVPIFSNPKSRTETLRKIGAVTSEGFLDMLSTNDHQYQHPCNVTLQRLELMVISAGFRVISVKTVLSAPAAGIVRSITNGWLEMQAAYSLGSNADVPGLKDINPFEQILYHLLQGHSNLNYCRNFLTGSALNVEIKSGRGNNQDAFDDKMDEFRHFEERGTPDERMMFGRMRDIFERGAGPLLDD